MPNRQLTAQELADLFAPLIADVRARLVKLSGGDANLLFALRRKLAKELSYDERGTPTERNKLKAFKRGQQNNKCANCGRELPEENVVLDRIEAMKGYTRENTRLLCRDCDYAQQKVRGFA